MRIKTLIAALLLLTIFTSEVGADTVHLKNGRKIKGLIKKETEESIVLDLGFGTVKFRRVEIEKIERSDTNEVAEIKEEWRVDRKKEEAKWQKREREIERAKWRKQFEPKEVSFSQDSQRIIVEALLNKKVKASLLLDTGATTMVLSENIAKKLGIKTKTSKKDMIEVQVADGRKVDAIYTTLDSVSVEGIEANNIGAVILLDTEASIEDGLLGMSFLNRFNFQINNVKKKLILQKKQHN